MAYNFTTQPMPHFLSSNFTGSSNICSSSCTIVNSDAELVSVNAATHEALEKSPRKDSVGARWELKAKDMARALSYKTRKSTIPPLKPGQIDVISNYNVLVDHISDDVLINAATAPSVLTPKYFEEGQGNYEALEKYCHQYPIICRKFFPGYLDNFCAKIHFRQLKCDNEAETADGAFTITPAPDEWKPPSPKHNQQILIPITVANDPNELIVQASICAKKLFSASPLRHFALVLGYDHQAEKLYFVVFHNGGVSVTEPLSLTDALHRKEISRLFLAILTWKTPGDAGLPEWLEGRSLRLPRSANDTEGISMNVSKILSSSHGIRSRVRMVLRCEAATRERKSGNTHGNLNLVCASNFISTNRKRKRESETESKNLEPRPAQHPLDAIQDAVREKIILPGDDGGAKYVPQDILQEYTSCNITTDDTDLVLKYSWLYSKSTNVEGKMLKDCSGMFGVVDHYFSYMVAHKLELVVTNHLFLPETANPVGNEHGEREYRNLWVHVSKFAGESLVSVDTPRVLVMSLAHAILGYRNMIFKGYYHRDISIGNIRWHKEVVEKMPLHEQFKNAPSELAELVKKLGIDRECYGFIIDGNLAVDFATHDFIDPRQNGRCGTKEFMSRYLLEPYTYTDEGSRVVQSPIDDFFSFFYVAQWAAVFNNAEFTDAEHPVPISLTKLRLKLYHNHAGARSTVTTHIQQLFLEPEHYGQFLLQSRLFLSEWLDLLVRIHLEFWYPKHISLITTDPANPSETYPALFRKLTDKLVIETLRLMDKHLSSTLS